MQVPTYPPQIALIELEHTPGGPAQSLAKMGVRTLLQRELPDASLQAAGHIEKRKHERKGSAGNDDIARILGSARFPHQVPRQHRCCGKRALLSTRAMSSLPALPLQIGRAHV